MILTDEFGNPLQPKVVTIEEIVNKSSWDSEDIELLVANQHLLEDEVLAMLGILEEMEALSPGVVAEQTNLLKKKKNKN